MFDKSCFGMVERRGDHYWDVWDYYWDNWDHYRDDRGLNLGGNYRKMFNWDFFRESGSVRWNACLSSNSEFKHFLLRHRRQHSFWYSFTTVNSFSPDEWDLLMNILARIDVYMIQHLQLELSNYPPVSGVRELFGMDRLGPVLGSGRFSGLERLTLRMPFRPTFRKPDDPAIWGLGQEGSAHLAAALSTGRLTNLRELSLPACDVSAILGSLIEGNISNLVAFKVESRKGHDKIFQSRLSQKLDAGFKTGCFKSLRLLHLSNGVFDEADSWEVFTRAVKFGKLPEITTLCLSQNALLLLSLADLFPLLLLNSFKNLIMDGCCINSEQVGHMVDAIIGGPVIGLELKHLDLHDNFLNSGAVDALVRLANSDRLPKLQELNLSMNKGLDLRSFLSLKETIQRGHLPCLERLKWEGNPDLDAVAEAIARAYFEDESLTTIFDIEWNLVSDLSLKTKANEYRYQNSLRIALKKKNKGELQDVVPLKCAKVFLCGYPLVGKTTLRKTLIRSHGSKWVTSIRERLPNFEQRTRGIELSSLVAKEPKTLKGKLAWGKSAYQLEETKINMELVLWDLAGQEEFHVLHGTFLADMAFAGGRATSGRATTFILVFKSKFEKDVDKKLCYWLRFVASSSNILVRRHVVVVLNCFEKCTMGEKTLWMGLIKQFEEVFSDLLDICLDPFIVDVRSTTSVQPLKNHLFDHARSLLQTVTVPRLCLDLQEELRAFQQGKNDNHLPILSWEAFEKALKLKQKENPVSGEALKAATLYLHEMGRLIYFDEMKPTEQGFDKRSVVVPDPEWFCSRVVGQLLVPKEISDEGCSMIVRADGSIPIIRFQDFFENQLDHGTRTDDVISMLELMGLCFKKGTNHIVVPALIQKDNYSVIDWEGKGFHGVMGRCLASEDQARSAIPMTLFRRLQVELAQDMNCGGREDSEYRAGKSFSSFKVGGLWVMVQFDVDHSDPTDDRIDILVRSMIRGDSTVASLAQATCICEIMQKVEKLCVVCCPGLKYDIKVIKPWSTTEKTPDMIERELMSLRQVKVLLMGEEKYSSWQLNGDPVHLKSFLSERELNDVLGIKTLALQETDDPVGSSKAIEDPEEPDFWPEVYENSEDSDVSDESENPDLSSQTEETEEPDLESKLTALTCSDLPFVPLLEQLDDMVYEVYTPAHLETPDLEVVFFHGLQLKYGNETYLKTWMTRDDSQLWLKTLLVQKFPGIRIVVVSYDSSAEKTPTQGLMDMYLIAENLLGSLTSNAVNLGKSGRPVVLVGHCFGGLVMKELCLRAQKMLGLMKQNLSEMGQIDKFIGSLRGLFFYGTPQSGSGMVDLLYKCIQVEGPLLDEMRVLEKTCARRNSEFEQLRRGHQWLTRGVGESRETFLDFLGKSIHVVREASSRPSMDSYKTDGGADHFDVCKPAGPSSSSFLFLVEFLSQIRDAEPSRAGVGRHAE